MKNIPLSYRISYDSKDFVKKVLYCCIFITLDAAVTNLDLQLITVTNLERYVRVKILSAQWSIWIERPENNPKTRFCCHALRATESGKLFGD